MAGPVARAHACAWLMLSLACSPALPQGMETAPAATPESPPALFSTDQATRGKSAYLGRCAHCHGRELTGGAAPALSGPQFFTREMNNRLSGVFSYLVHEMPQDRPGSLTHGQYVDIMAYLLDRNGYPSGPAALTYESALQSSAIVYFAARP